VKVIRLEQNFRSTGHILDVANAVIDQNETRLGKTLFTTAEKGEKVELVNFLDAEDESRWIVDRIKGEISKGTVNSDIAVLTRASHVLNLVCQKMTREGIPYVLSGGRRFQDRAEVRDAVAYLRLAANPDDSSAFERVVNVPKRGMGDMAIKKIIDAAEQARQLRANMTLIDISKNFSVGKSLSGNVPEQLSGFVSTIQKANRLFWRGESSAEILKLLLNDSGYIADLRQQLADAKDAEDVALAESVQTRIDNVLDLFNMGKDRNPLELIEHLGLTEDGRAKKGEAVWVGTIHAAKGLEWPLVFGVGWEENILPSWQALQEGGNALDEERRCAYVLITRARTKLYLTTSLERFQKPSSPSRFLGDIPEENSINTEI
jgi:DNA helicase-2/ATP-dependent DNA helicase PcrA